MKAKAKTKPVSDAETIPNDLPEGWAVTTLGDVSVRIQYGYTASATQTNGPRFLRITDIQDGKVNWVSVPSCDISNDDADKYSLKPGDIVFARTGATTGKSFLIRSCPPAVFASYLIRVRGQELVKPSFLSQYFNTPQYWEFISDNVAGNAQPNCNASKLAALLVPLAPVPEQERIATRIESLLQKVNASRDHLAKVPKILKAFRQSVLASAFSGRLTEEWREMHPGVQSGSDLLTAIRKKRLAAAQHAKERNQIDEAFNDQFLAVREDDPGLNELPDSWIGCRVGAIGTVVNGSTPSRKYSKYWGGTINWVSSGEVRNNIITTTRETITTAGYDGSSVRMLPRGTVLLAMIGEGKTRGQSSILAIEATINQNIAAVIISHGLLLPEYLWRWFHFQYEATREHGGGTGPQALNCQRVRELPFVLPPLEEQHEIVRRVEILFKLATKIEKRVEAATKRTDKLTQAILAKAFRGDLVPTEAELARQEGRDYEPASVLLERIKSDRETTLTARKSTPGRVAIRTRGRTLNKR